MALTICSINVNGITEQAKRQKVFQALCNSPFDIYLIQETHLPDLNQGVIWEQQWGGRALWSPGTNRSAGVGILFHPRCTVEITDSKLDSEGRVLAVKLKSATSTFQVANIYAPNKPAEREVFFQSLWRTVFRNTDTIVGGDFNCVPSPLIDKWGGDDTLGDKGIPQLHDFTNSLDLEDFFPD